jgi:hypothetical protein
MAMGDKQDKLLDPIQMAKDGLFAERRDGVVRIIDALTGKVVAIQETTKVTAPEDFTPVLLPDGQVVQVQKGFEKYAMDATKQPELTPFLVDIMCQMIVEDGLGISEVCQKPGMPKYATLAMWRRKHAWVAQALANAREDRAERMRDKAVIEAEKAQNPDYDNDKLRVETYKWAAGVDDSKFSPRAKVEATINSPTQIIVVTGIDKAPLPQETNMRDVSQKKDSTK